MRAVKAEDKERYLETARTWEYDRMRAAIQSRRVAWTVAGGACRWRWSPSARSPCCAAQDRRALCHPGRSLDRRNRDRHGAEGPQPHTYDDAVNRYFIAQYVRLREGWLNDAARENAYTVMLMSQQAEAAAIWLVESSNKNAPSNVYGDGGYVSISIRSISYLSPTVAQVRFSKIITMGQNTPVAQNWNAILTFKYTTAPEHEKDRTINPLGFQVVNYRSDPEA
jgi:type IV secretion system protein VirB8